MRTHLFLVLTSLSLIQTLDAKPVRHFAFFAMDREKIKTAHSFLNTSAFEGAQVAYTWRQLEPQKDVYDFSLIREDMEFLKAKGKKLFIQIQDVSFSERRIHVPRYLVEEAEFNGGADRQYPHRPGLSDEQRTPGGWMARRWDPKVRERFHRLLNALGKEFDGKIEGINLAETSCEVRSGELSPKGFTREAYREGIIANMKAMRQAFKRSVVMIYANFMPGDWLPDQDHGHLRAVYAASKELNVGVGGPDVLPYKPGQMNNSYHLIRDAVGRVPIGMAVQDGNYEHINPKTGKQVTAREIFDFAAEYLKTDYLFWGIEEPYFTEQTIPFLKRSR